MMLQVAKPDQVAAEEVAAEEHLPLNPHLRLQVVMAEITISDKNVE